MNNLDFNIIAANCLIATKTDSKVVIQNLESIKAEFTEIQLIAIFNYFLKIEYNAEVLSWLIKTLDKYRDSSSLQPLTDLLLMENYTPNADFDREYYNDIRALCAKAISNLKDHSSVYALLQCLNNKNENYKVRLSCADALGRLGDKYAVTTLMDVVSDEEEKSVYIRESAAVALGLIGDMRAVDTLVKVLESKNGIVDKFSYLKEKAIEAICRLNPNNDRTFNALKNSLHDESAQVRINAIEALLEYETQEADDLIKTMLFDIDEEVQKNAVIAVYNIGGEAAMKEILNSNKFSEICKTEAQNLLNNIEDYE